MRHGYLKTGKAGNGAAVCLLAVLFLSAGCSSPPSTSRREVGPVVLHGEIPTGACFRAEVVESLRITRRSGDACDTSTEPAGISGVELHYGQIEFRGARGEPDSFTAGDGASFAFTLDSHSVPVEVAR